MKRILIWGIEKYQEYISELLGNKCRFYPTCSEYTKQALEKYGVSKGLFLRNKENCQM